MLSEALKVLRKDGKVKIKRVPGAGIPKSVYYIADPTRTAFELERDNIIERILENPAKTADQLKDLQEQIQQLKLAVRMLSDASGFRVEVKT